MNNQPQISVILPIYNASAYLHEALESVLQQTFTDFELLVIDDGSTDNSVEIVKSYDDWRIRLISNAHDFISSLNKGIEAATGKYIARMDADDVMLPHRLETQFQFMETDMDIDICGSFAECFGIRQQIMQNVIKHRQIISMLLLTNPLIHPSVMIRRTVFGNGHSLRYPDGYPCAEDYKLWTVLAGKGYRFANIPEVLMRYRRSSSQVTERDSATMRETSLKIQMEYADWVIEQIADKEKRYSDFFEHLVGLFNDELISFSSVLRIIYQVYVEFLERNEIEDNG